MENINSVIDKDYADFKKDFEATMKDASMAQVDAAKADITSSVELTDGEVNEAVIEIPTTDFKGIKKGMSGLGLKTKVDKSDGVVDVTVQSDKDKKALRDWMLSNGWDKTDIKDAFPELNESEESSEEEEDLDEAVQIDDAAYKAAHGKKPKGRGKWSFGGVDGSNMFAHEGTYREACTAAKKHYRRLNDTNFGILSVQP